MAEVIILENDKYTLEDEQTAKNKKLQIVYMLPRKDHDTIIFLKNGVEIIHKYTSYRELSRDYLFVRVGKRNIESDFRDSISDICSLANRYNTISMTQVIKLAVESENRYADEIAERRLNRSKKEILTLAEQIKELKEITTNEFVNTNSKISKKR